MATATAPVPGLGVNGDEPFIQCDNLVKIYKTEELEVVALQGLDLNIRRGEMMAIIGNSGSGKSSLLNILGGLDRPSAGQCRVGDLDLVQASESELVRYRRHQVGFMWQQSSRNLIPYLTAFENVQAPMLFANIRKPSQRARGLLTAVGLEDRMQHRLSQLSGGQQQRVAIAISLANDPELLLADEPTGEVDTQTAAQIYDILRHLNEQRDLTIIIVSHDRNIASQVERVVAIRDGRTSTETVRRVSVHGDGEHTHDEYVIVDDVGRLQVPREMLDQLGIGGRAVVDVEGDQIVIRSEPAAAGVEIVRDDSTAADRTAERAPEPTAPRPAAAPAEGDTESEAPEGAPTGPDTDSAGPETARATSRAEPDAAARQPAGQTPAAPIAEPRDEPSAPKPAAATPREIPPEHRQFAPPTQPDPPK